MWQNQQQAHRRLPPGPRSLVGVRNLLGLDYVDTVRINAFNDRFFEPGPPRHVYAQLSVGFR